MRADRTGMQCQGCPRSWDDAPGKPVWGIGSTASGIAFVAEAAAFTEVFRGEPLVGPTGWWFRNLLSDAGLRFDDVYRTNAVLCAGRGAELGRDWPAVEHCSPSLAVEVRALIAAGIKVFVPMGNAALHGLCPELTVTTRKGAVVPMGVTFARGYVFPGPEGAWVVPTFHPSPKNLKGKGSGWALVVNDILKAKRIVAQGGPRLPAFKRILAPTLAQVRAYFERRRPLVVDIENTMSGQIVCIGFCDGQTTLVLPLLTQGGGDYWGSEYASGDWIAVAEILHDVFAHWPTIFQNGEHDVPWLEAAGFHVGNWVFDTLKAHATAYPDQLHSLHHLGSLYREGPPWKHGYQESAAPEEGVD